MAAKSIAGPTISQQPGCFPYLLEHTLTSTAEQRALQTEIESSTGALMAGAPEEAQFLAWLCEVIGARKVLEIGVFRGSTTLALALALPAVSEGGKVVGLDVSEEYVSTAKKYWAQAGVTEKIELRIQDAVKSMDDLIAEGHSGTFDLVFVDADKPNYDKYYEKALELLRRGGVVAVDNVLWGGRMVSIPEAEWDERTKAIDALNKKIRADGRVKQVMLCLADGLTLCRKL